jgi:pimeloyl-ACP methyl ester carboxylesterase
MIKKAVRLSKSAGGPAIAGIVAPLRSRVFPVQIIWGEADPALRVTTFGEIARRAAGLDHIHRLPGKHFLQEDQSPALAELISTQARP